MIIGIFGEMGSGKTLLLTILGKYAYDMGYKIYSNYKVNFEYTPVDIFQLLDMNLENCVLLLDEAYNYLDARLSQTQINTLLSHLVFQTRKRNVHLLFTAQLLRSVDVRLRNLLNLIIVAQKVNKGFKYTIFKETKVFSLYLKEKDAKKFYTLYNTYEVIEDEIFKMKKEKLKLDIEKLKEKLKKEKEELKV
jgi:ABC-type multidrug transport system ATPase subunit